MSSKLWLSNRSLGEGFSEWSNLMMLCLKGSSERAEKEDVQMLQAPQAVCWSGFMNYFHPSLVFVFTYFHFMDIWVEWGEQSQCLLAVFQKAFSFKYHTSKKLASRDVKLLPLCLNSISAAKNFHPPEANWSLHKMIVWLSEREDPSLLSTAYVLGCSVTSQQCRLVTLGLMAEH